jgi:hypothetical protein
VAWLRLFPNAYHYNYGGIYPLGDLNGLLEPENRPFLEGGGTVNGCF